MNNKDMEIKLKSTSVLIYLLLLGGNYSASIKKVMVGLHIPLRADAFRGRGPSLLVAMLLWGLGCLACPAGVAALHSMCFSL